MFRGKAKLKTMTKLRPNIVFDVLILLFFVYLVWEANEWKLQARLYPWVIGIPMVVLAVIHLAMDLKGSYLKKSSDAVPVDFQFAKGIDPILAKWRTLNCFSWIIGFLASVWLVGFSISIAVGVFLYLKMQAKEGLVLSVVLTSACWLIYWGLFEQILYLPFPEGKIFLWMGF